MCIFEPARVCVWVGGGGFVCVRVGVYLRAYAQARVRVRAMAESLDYLSGRLADCHVIPNDRCLVTLAQTRASRAPGWPRHLGGRVAAPSLLQNSLALLCKRSQGVISLDRNRTRTNLLFNTNTKAREKSPVHARAH